MQAKDIMSSPVVTVTPDASVAEAAALLLEKRISGVPVVDQTGQIVGILSEGDLLRRVETDTQRHRPHWLEMLLGQSGDASSFIKSHASRVGDVMSHDVIASHPEASLREIAELMERHGIKRVPILDGGGSCRHRQPRKPHAGPAGRPQILGGIHQRRTDPRQAERPACAPSPGSTITASTWSSAAASFSSGAACRTMSSAAP